ncbi:MAG: RsmD family RNA methyltransferase, partial [Eubacteriales bacterium]|nr:RsmD family RNA methyltransferase [Eubacteriales bacterium]
MRVVAGAYKGRRLICPAGNVRPTTDKVKEAMFGALQFDIEGAVVLDAFAGSGALGIEALSRGAAHVDFAEKNGGCLRVLKENIKAVVTTENYDIYKGDVIKLMPDLKKYDILLLDP